MKFKLLTTAAIAAAGAYAYKKNEKKLRQYYYGKKAMSLAGNGSQYDLANDPDRGDLLKGKTIAYLGSSVTYGAASGAVSFADYISRHTGAEMIKEAVSGTTLVDEGKESYIARMKNIPVDAKIDLFVLQLSTNDATQNKPLGEIGYQSPYQTMTITGAIQEIVEYAEMHWHCPVMIYTNAYYESEAYAQMVKRVHELQGMYHYQLIDLYTDKEFNEISEEKRKLYMADPIHPTRAGYQLWWTPVIEKKIVSLLQ